MIERFVKRRHLARFNASGLGRDTSGEPGMAARTPVMSAEQRAILLQLKAGLDLRKEEALPSVALNSVIPDHIRTRPQLKSLWGGVADLVVLDIASRCPKMLVFLASPSLDRQAALQLWGAPWMVVQLKKIDRAAVEGAARLIEERLASDANTEPFKKLPCRQWLLGQQIRQILHVRSDPRPGALPPSTLTAEALEFVRSHVERDLLLVGEEVALSRVISPETADLSVLEFIATSSVDILIMLSNRESPCLPLLAVEFDGVHHEDIEQRIKDALKDRLLRDAGIPLLRIKDDEPRIVSWQPIGKGGRQASSHEFDAMQQRLAPFLHLLREVAFDAKQSWDEMRAWYEAQLKLEALCVSRFGKVYSDLSDDEELALNRLEAYTEVMQGILMDAHDREERQVFEAEMEDLTALLLSARLDPMSALDLKIERDVHTGAWSSEFTHVHPDGSRSIVPLPALRLTATGLNEERITRIYSRFARSEIVATLKDFAQSRGNL